MRNTRGVFASLGASASIVAAVALLLLTVSAVIALQGWPGLGHDGPGSALVVDGSVLPSTGHGVRRRVRHNPAVPRR
ncbi:MAG: hypothetical protein M3296_06890, partial [Actinomycetota bacterium]|nr:hypothetical protein [Actinomycetota bacterium]